jgi:hypothetical protein
MPPADLGATAFASDAVFVPSRGYPVLQPLCLGASQALLGERFGRLLLPGLFVLLIGISGLGARRAGLARLPAWVLALAVALTPMWVNPGAGSVDSGYAEVFLALALTTCGVALVLEDWRLLLVGAFFLPQLKPEGLPYGAGLLVLTVLTASRRIHWAASAGFGLGLALFWLVRARLTEAGTTGPLLWAGLVLGIGATLAAQEWVLRVRPRPRTLALLAVTAVGAVVGALFLFQTELSRSTDSLASAFLGGLGRVPDRLRQLPELLLGCLEYLTFVRKYGLVWPLVLGLLLLPRRVAGPCPHRPLAAFLGLGLGMAFVALFLTPEPDPEHEFRSRFDRLLLQWVGVGWLVVVLWLGRPSGVMERFARSRETGKSSGSDRGQPGLDCV